MPNCRASGLALVALTGKVEELYEIHVGTVEKVNGIDDILRSWQAAATPILLTLPPDGRDELHRVPLTVFHRLIMLKFLR